MNSFSKYGKGRRNSAFSGVCLAAMLAVVASPTLAQESLGFEDPLTEMRAQVEQLKTGKAPDAVQEATLASVDGENVVAPPDVKDPLSRISDRFGLPVLGLVALAGLALLALLLGLMWLVTRLSTRRTPYTLERLNYSFDDEATDRRKLEGDRRKARNISEDGSRSTDYGKIAVPSAASAAAAIISDDDAPDMSEYELTETDISDEAVSAEFDSHSAAVAADTATQDHGNDAADPSSWRRPNLDRLKASIMHDWRGGKEDAATEADAAMSAEHYGDAEAMVGTADTPDTATNEQSSALSREAENFADLFGDDDPAAAVADEGNESLFSDGLGSARTDSATTLSDLRSTVADKTADITSSDMLEKRRAELPSREDAMRRIRALRESVKAS